MSNIIPQATPGPVIRHPRHYDPLGKLTFRAGHVIFRYNPHVIAPHSPVFADMFRLGPMVPAGGASDDNPIVLHDSPLEAEELFDWCNNLNSNSKTMDNWLALLRVAEKYQIERAEEHALNRLEALATAGRLSVSQKFFIAYTYDIKSWLSPSFHDLVRLPPTSWKVEDHSLLGPIAVHHIMMTRHRALSHRQECASAPDGLPRVKHSDLCTNNPRCQNRWELAFCAATRLMVTPGPWIQGEEVLQKLRDTQIPRVPDDCRMAACNALSNSGALWRDREFIDMGLEDLLAALK